MALETAGPDRTRVPLNVAVRKDNWWLKPLLTVLGLGFFAVYATARAFEGAHFHAGPYLSPFYSPEIDFGLKLGDWKVSPAFYILPFPLFFRMTCYYYRQAYYRSFFADPVACAVPEPSFRKKYNGERAFPLVLQNLHRYALYFALLILVVLWYDAIKAFWHEGSFYLGLGGPLMVANAVLLSGYTFGCHSFRHLVGGKADCFSCAVGSGEYKTTPGYGFWKTVTMFNRNHMQWAWASLFSVILTDVYVRLLATGALTDPRLF
jgi:hypothetical protein